MGIGLLQKVLKQHHFKWEKIGQNRRNNNKV
jgi:hypothetical protein